MDQPEKLILGDSSTLDTARSGLLAGIGMMIFVGGIVLTQTDASPKDLVLPFGALSVFWLAWVVIHLFIWLGHRIGDRRAINRLFESEIWQQWQFRAEEWQGIVDTEYREMCPEEGAGAYVGAVYSGIMGLILSAFLVAVGKFAIDDEQIMPYIWICAVAVLLLLIGVGLYQPIQARRKARAYRKRALRTAAPRVWFGADGVYHEAFGYTSLKVLTDVADHTKKSKTIEFTIQDTAILGGQYHIRYTYFLTLPYPVPSGYEQEATRLVHRYRVERLTA